MVGVVVCDVVVGLVVCDEVADVVGELVCDVDRDVVPEVVCDVVGDEVAELVGDDVRELVRVDVGLVVCDEVAEVVAEVVCELVAVDVTLDVCVVVVVGVVVGDVVGVVHVSHMAWHVFRTYAPMMPSSSHRLWLKRALTPCPHSSGSGTPLQMFVFRYVDVTVDVAVVVWLDVGELDGVVVGDDVAVVVGVVVADEVGVVVGVVRQGCSSKRSATNAAPCSRVESVPSQSRLWTLSGVLAISSKTLRSGFRPVSKASRWTSGLRNAPTRTASINAFGWSSGTRVNPSEMVTMITGAA